jgi:hypothetical protein
MPVKIFFCYAREDEALRQGLEKQLRALRRQGIIHVWHDRDISAGSEWAHEIDTHLNNAQIILLLVSPDFMDSDYCYGIEMRRAMERNERGEAQVVPIILRPIYWQGAPFSKLQALPTDAIPIMSSKWHNLDEAFFDVAEGIRKAVEKRLSKPAFPVQKAPLSLPILEPAGESDPITFNRRNQEDEYRRWVANHPNNGFIVVRDSSKWRVHHTSCPHITGPIKKGQNLMTYPKICSTTLSKLRSEAEKHNGTILTNCACQQKI